MSQVLGNRTVRLLLAGAIALAAFWWFGNSMTAGPTSGWKTDFSKSIIDLDLVVSGGVPRDGIPPIDNPRFQPVGSVVHLSPNSPLVAVNVAGDARAYPLEVLTRHEIVNDVVGEIPVAVTFCPLCNSALVYDRRVDGETLRFGVTGNLLNSDLIMWDDATESWWQQLTGYAIVGEYSGAAAGIRDVADDQLRRLPRALPPGQSSAGSLRRVRPQPLRRLRQQRRALPVPRRGLMIGCILPSVS